MDEMQRFKETYITECDELLEDMEGKLFALDENNPDMEDLNAIFRCANSIKGGSGALGFDKIKALLKEIVARNPAKKRIRIWSSASSSGQEPYSIAMTLCDAVPNLSQWDAKILATDIDTNMLDSCRQGEYKAEMLEDIPAEYHKKYTLKSGKDNIIMADSIKKLLTFKQLNLLHDFPMKGPFDFIFCRSVVIYFDKLTQVDLFNRMADILKPDGLLYIGHSESLFKVSERFELVDRTTYRRIK